MRSVPGLKNPKRQSKRYQQHYAVLARVRLDFPDRFEIKIICLEKKLNCFSLCVANNRFSEICRIDLKCGAFHNHTELLAVKRMLFF